MRTEGWRINSFFAFMLFLAAATLGAFTLGASQTAPVGENQPRAWRTGNVCMETNDYPACVALCADAFPAYTNGDTSAALTCRQGAIAKVKQ